MELVPRYFQHPGQSFFLFGPRGTGKSTWLKHHLPDALFIDLLEPDTFRAYSARPERLREIAEGQEKGTVIVIDEVQKIPQILDVVHQLLEMRRDLVFILTGSSARKLRRAGVNLLAGRAVIREMHPFMASEMGDSFSLDRALVSGMLPLVIASPNPDDTLKAYASFYLKEEVQMEGLVRKMGAFSRFMESISFSHGGILNVTDVSRDCQVERKTVEGFVSILEDLLLAFRIPSFQKRAKRHLTSHPKFYYFDAGVFRSLRPAGPLDSPQEIDGAALEGLICQHLKAWIAYSGGRDHLYFWRTKSGNEVDFIIYGKDTFYAVEVKNSGKISPKMLRGLLAFKEDYGKAQTCLLYRGKERLKIKGVVCLPCEDFLKGLTPNKPILS
jgi:predicted AAA+ superfamily ATPase